MNTQKKPRPQDYPTALLFLNDLVLIGRVEFPEAVHEAASCFDVCLDELIQQYDDQFSKRVVL
jgi:hypothetical protein